MRVLLTGASGYIGLHLVRELLDAGHHVTAAIRSPAKLGPFLQDPRLRALVADLDEQAPLPQGLEGHDVCVHAALIWGDPGSEFELRDTAVAAKLFDAAGRAGLSRCIFLSSAAVHRPFRGEMREEDALSTDDLYGATKAAGELVLRAACAQHGMTGVVLRPGPVVGPPAFPGAALRTNSRLAAMVATAGEAQPIEVTAGEGRQWTDVAALAKVTRLLVDAEDPHPTVLCVDREPLTWEEIARTVVATLDSSSEVRVEQRATIGPPPRFLTHRLDALLGQPTDARSATVAHIRHLARTS